MNAAYKPEPEAKTWQQTKSERTRETILTAAIDCFFELGYFNTTTENIAQQAGVSRGAMLHHFPTRADLIKAAVEHLHRRRLEMFTEEESTIQQGAEHTRVEESIDAYWRQLNTREFAVFQELKVAARTDPELARVLKPILEAYDRAWAKASSQVFSDLAKSEAFTRTAQRPGARPRNTNAPSAPGRPWATAGRSPCCGVRTRTPARRNPAAVTSSPMNTGATTV